MAASTGESAQAGSASGEVAGDDDDDEDDDGGAQCRIQRHASHIISAPSDAAAGALFAPLLFRPCVVQISRWDALKGFVPLLLGFSLLKANRRDFAARGTTHGSAHDQAATARRSRVLCNAALVLCGPEPSSVSDDPEGEAALADLCSAFDALPADVRDDVFILLLPTKDAEVNASIVNAIVRSSVLVVQNSSAEGFGLTCAEARFKGRPVVGTRASGIRAQSTSCANPT